MEKGNITTPSEANRDQVTIEVPEDMVPILNKLCIAERKTPEEIIKDAINRLSGGISPKNNEVRRAQGPLPKRFFIRFSLRQKQHRKLVKWIERHDEIGVYPGNHDVFLLNETRLRQFRGRANSGPP